tara:strand:+ start:929 stop:1030 length:102 start_codon:yes stop_codon:yes gene_type:complete
MVELLEGGGTSRHCAGGDETIADDAKTTPERDD